MHDHVVTATEMTAAPAVAAVAEPSVGPPTTAAIDHPAESHGDPGARAAGDMSAFDRRVWDGKAIGEIHQRYAPNVRVLWERGPEYGRDAVVEHATRFLAAFPDLRSRTEDVVVCSDGAGGSWISSRVTFLGRNTGWSVWGPPTGRPIAVSQLVNRYMRAGAVREEYAVHNTAALVRQLGHDAVALARRSAPGQAGSPVARAVGEPERGLGHRAPEPAAADDGPGVETWTRRLLHELYNERRLDRVATHFAADLRFHGSGDRELYGRDDYVAHVLGTLAMFPDAAYRIEHTFSASRSDGTDVVVARWSLDGTHRGWGRLGAPTGRRVRQWGLTHLRVRHGRIAEEWTYSNEFDTLQQIHSEEAA